MSPYPLSNIELLTWLLRHEELQPILGGVYSRDNLPRRHHYKPTLYLANTAIETHPTGMHWIAMLVGIPIPEYFDSLGLKPHNDFVTFLGPCYIYCSMRLQSPLQPSCGYYCLYYALCRAQGVPFHSIMNSLYGIEDLVVIATIQQLGIMM